MPTKPDDENKKNNFKPKIPVPTSKPPLQSAAATPFKPSSEPRSQCGSAKSVKSFATVSKSTYNIKSLKTLNHYYFIKD